MILELPDERMDAKGNDCGRAAVRCVLRRLGVAARVVFAPTDLDGTHPATLESFLRRHVHVLSGEMRIRQLRDLANDGIPVLCPVNLFGGHWVVVGGVERGRVRYHCPIDGPSSKRAAAFEALWFDATRQGERYARWGIACWV